MYKVVGSLLFKTSLFVNYDVQSSLRRGLEVQHRVQEHDDPVREGVDDKHHEGAPHPGQLAMDHRDVEVAEDEVVSPEGVHQSHQEDLLRVVVVLHARLGLVDRLHAAVLHVPVVLVAKEHHRQQALLLVE